MAKLVSSDTPIIEPSVHVLYRKAGVLTLLSIGLAVTSAATAAAAISGSAIIVNGFAAGGSAIASLVTYRQAYRTSARANAVEIAMQESTSHGSPPEIDDTVVARSPASLDTPKACKRYEPVWTRRCSSMVNAKQAREIL